MYTLKDIDSTNNFTGIMGPRMGLIVLGPMKSLETSALHHKAKNIITYNKYSTVKLW